MEQRRKKWKEKLKSQKAKELNNSSQKAKELKRKQK